MSDENATPPLRAVGWRMLVDPIGVKEESESGIKYPKEVIQAQEYLRYVGKVIDMGPLCFKDSRFAGLDEPPCKVGDWVVFARNSGSDVYINEGPHKVCQLKLINDDMIWGVAEDPKLFNIPLPGL